MLLRNTELLIKQGGRNRGRLRCADFPAQVPLRVRKCRFGVYIE